ncbi:MAG TPA: ATP-binding protein [Allosphingosinicella sp.]|nr:ATP-binding protein [Allosphingosinicella sp.]
MSASDLAAAKPGTLHLVCGKIGAGKSTLCARLASEPGTFLVSQDRWLSALYPDELETIPDMIRYSGRLRSVMGPHVSDLLRAGLSVVLDFPANTIDLRRWMLDVAEAADAPHLLHFLDLPDETCRARLRRRNAEGAHEYVVGDEEFDVITAYFQPPGGSEGLTIRTYGD